MKVPFLDLGRLHSSIRSELNSAIAEVIDTSSFVSGNPVERFEQEFAARVMRKHCVAVNSGTSALHLALLVAGLVPGDEVVTTPLTWISTAWAISYCGANPIFADVDSNTGNLDPLAVDEAVTPRTKAIVTVDLYGNPAPLEDLNRSAERRGLILVDDACQAHGARLNERPVGSFGGLACFSFYPTKNLGGIGEGGAIVTDDDGLDSRLRRLRDHAQAERHYHTELGFNYRMDGIQAAVLCVKLHHLEEWNARRRRAATTYRELLSALEPEVILPAVTPGGEPNWHLYVVRVEDRDRVLRALLNAGIEAKIHYPVPVHRQRAYKELGYGLGAFPNSERFAKKCISLPMHPMLTHTEQDYVVESLANAIEVAR